MIDRSPGGEHVVVLRVAVDALLATGPLDADDVEASPVEVSRELQPS